ncbi:MAG: 3-hydroxybutyryl-CoA dehydrogenase, partial [Rhodospirillaceae bacterium]|nr:3-hydroxybutyryl-CoA dehydrogenase [Rhodospirillaceae bacterium]
MTIGMTKIGVIGAGQMGCGIAHVSALAGYDVTLYDLSQERIEA